MCALAARMLDPTTHGGIIIAPCCPTVIIENMPAARVGDLHTCPQVTGTVPHVGGPILPPGAPTVLIGSLPAARQGDWCVCVGPTDTILLGALTVDIGPPPIPPPPFPGIGTPGGLGGGAPYQVNWMWVTNWVAGVNAGVGWNVAAVVSLAAAALVALAACVVVWPPKAKFWDSRGRDHDVLPDMDHHGGGCGCRRTYPKCDEEGVPDDAPVYFL